MVSRHRVLVARTRNPRSRQKFKFSRARCVCSRIDTTMECRSPWKQDDRAVSAEKVYLRITKGMERTGEARFRVEFVLNLCMRARAHVYANSSSSANFFYSSLLFFCFTFSLIFDRREERGIVRNELHQLHVRSGVRGSLDKLELHNLTNEFLFYLVFVYLTYQHRACRRATSYAGGFARTRKKLRPTSEQARRWIPPDESGTLCACVPTYTVSRFVISAEEKYTERERKREMKIKIDTEKQKRGVKKCTYMDRLFLFFGSGRRRSNLSLPSAPKDFNISLSTISRSVNVELNDHSYCTILWVSRNCRAGKNDSININNNNNQ